MGRIVPLGAFVSAAVLALTPTPALADPALQAADAPGLAMFEGRQVDLSRGWGEARACMVRRAEPVECFRSAEAMSRREAGLITATASYSCVSPLRLYEHTWYGGRQLSFWSPGYWQNLGDYGFNDRTSSYKVGSCYAHLAEHSWGIGRWYPGYTGPYGWEPTMPEWNDRVSSIYNE